jgi:hypothetical protein
MIEFLTLLLNLVWGPQTVELAVAEGVARVELQLDGAPVASLGEPPWRTTIDLGAELLPRELAAIAFAADGSRLGETRQRINYGRNPTEAYLVFVPDSGRRRVRLLWESFDLEPPRRQRVTLDGSPLAVSASGESELPPLDPAAVHVLEAELEFANGQVARATLPFGGSYGERTTSEQTALPVWLDAQTPVPTPTATRGWFLQGETALEVAGVERGSPLVVVVRDANLPSRLPLDPRGRYALRAPVPDPRELPEVSFLAPAPRVITSEQGSVAIFDRLRLEAPPLDQGLLRIVATRSPRFARGRQQFFAALASAAKAAAAAGRPRVVLLLLDPRSPDASALGWPQVRTFLGALQVPLVVWIAPGSRSANTAEALRADPGLVLHRDLSAAVDATQALLDRQVIVWLQGAHFPHRIRRGPAAPAGVSLSPLISPASAAPAQR